ncbi:hypothetical protein FW774_12240 [Pedobacter sp. BS3]|uniref:hypothetical protein n=1 Tax=Pedobacter sp. BS3 TaxID=2567937 RepID=UPI0011ECDD0B|nr:hypothetical protein [Pedobacter sp. BS3]TZF83066.1 hypothetical protein FW774_12240 [Pedobacter sp. BS3]
MKTSVYFLGAAVLLAFSTCKKTGETFTGKQGTVMVINNSAGCGTIIKFDDGTSIEPINRTESNFATYLTNNNRVVVDYKERNDFVTACQNAKAAQIINIHNSGSSN